MNVHSNHMGVFAFKNRENDWYSKTLMLEKNPHWFFGCDKVGPKTSYKWTHGPYQWPEKTPQNVEFFHPNC